MSDCNNNFGDINSQTFVKKPNRNNKLKRTFGRGEMNIAALPAGTFSNIKIAGVFHIKRYTLDAASTCSQWFEEE